VVIPFPGPSLLPAVQEAMADEQVDRGLREALFRLATSEDLDERIAAFTELQEAALDEDVESTAPSPVVRFFPALAAIANSREGAERSALYAVVGTLEMLRLAAGTHVPEDLAAAWEEARVHTRRAVASSLGEELPAEGALRGLLCCLASLHGDVEIAEAIATGGFDGALDELDDFDDHDDHDQDHDEPGDVEPTD
jgi:hypothetical protein